MKLWKHLSSSIITIAITLTTAGVVHADESNSGNTESAITDAQTVANIEEFMGEQFSLLDTYENAEDVKDEYLGTYSTYVESLQKEFSLAELTVNTASDYKSAVLSSNSSAQIDVQPLLQFLDIYENEQENAEIISHFEEMSHRVNEGILHEEEAVEQARMLVPTKPENANDRPVYQPRNSGINLTAARNYARKHAVNPNPKYGVEKTKIFWDADCTNFASQILLAGGVGMDTYNDVYKGWWWKGKGNRSVSWINANTFKNYMGSGYSTRSWRSFVSNVRPGDFIGLDFGNDGSVDHIGFVYSKSGGRLRIAQHTRNYLDWNGSWPDSDNEGKYYRVRR